MHAIVLICDRLPLGLLGCYGNEWIETPNLDRFAADGFVFDNCFPHRPGPGACRFERGAEHDWLGLATEDVPLDRLLARSDLRATLIGDRAGLSVAGAFPDATCVPQPSIDPKHWANLDRILRDPRYRPPRRDDPRFEEWTARWRRQLGRDQREGDDAPRSIEAVFAEALRWLDGVGDGDSLLWLDLALFDADWLPPLEYRDHYLDEETGPGVLDPIPSFTGDPIGDADLEGMRAVVAGRVTYFDALFGAFLDELRELSLYDRSLLAITCDQGLPLGEHGLIGPHRPWMVEERDHAPLIVRVPEGRTMARSPALVQTVDLQPTLCDFFGVEAPGGSSLRSLLPTVLGKETSTRDYVCAGLADSEYAIRTHHWKLVLPTQPIPGDAARARQLYSKPEDRWEANDLVDQATETADRLELQLRRHLDAVRRGTLDSLPPLRDDLLRSGGW